MVSEKGMIEFHDRKSIGRRPRELTLKLSYETALSLRVALPATSDNNAREAHRNLML